MGETHFVSSDRKKTEGFKAYCCCFGVEIFLLACFVGENFFLFTFLFSITYQDITAEICTLKNMLINVITDSRFYFFHISCICSDPDMHCSFEVLQIQRQRASFYLLARTYQCSNASCSLPSMAMESI